MSALYQGPCNDWDLRKSSVKGTEHRGLGKGIDLCRTFSRDPALLKGMYVFMNVRMCWCICIYLYVYIDVYVCMYVWVSVILYAYMYVWRYVIMYMYLCACVYACMLFCMYACVTLGNIYHCLCPIICQHVCSPTVYMLVSMGVTNISIYLPFRVIIVGQ